VIVTGDLPAPGAVPPGLAGELLVAAVDVEWSKNYRIRGGNVPFCYSVIWLTLPRAGAGTSLSTPSFTSTSAYVHDARETGELAESAGLALEAVLERADVVAGHQFTSDLAVLAAASGSPPPGVTAARDAWRQRRCPGHWPQIVDTRYDAGHVLTCASRRLVDVCADLELAVTQPELRGTSMTALHRRWLETGDAMAREKISVLNLRHSLSTALVAARAAGFGSWPPGLNVSQLLASGLGSAFGWLSSPAFTALLEDRGAA